MMLVASAFKRIIIGTIDASPNEQRQLAQQPAEADDGNRLCTGRSDIIIGHKDDYLSSAIMTTGAST